MRNVYLAVIYILFSIGLGVVGEVNAKAIADPRIGYPLFYYSNTVNYNNTLITSNNFNGTLNNYGLDRIPALSGSDYYLGSGGQLLMTYNAFKDIFMFTTLGMNQFLETSFPSIQPGLLLLISVASSICNLIAAITFLRGFNIIKW